MEETKPKYQPLRFYAACSCIHAWKTIFMAPIHLFTRQIVHSLYEESLTWSSLKLIWQLLIFRMCLIKSFLPSKHYFYVCVMIILCYSLSFSSHTFSWTCRSLHEPKSFSSKGFQPNLYQHFPVYALPVVLCIFSLK